MASENEPSEFNHEPSLSPPGLPLFTSTSTTARPTSIVTQHERCPASQAHWSYHTRNVQHPAFGPAGSAACRPPASSVHKTSSPSGPARKRPCVPDSLVRRGNTRSSHPDAASAWDTGQYPDISPDRRVRTSQSSRYVNRHCPGRLGVFSNAPIPPPCLAAAS